jgi:hypothetical protein
MSWITWVSVLVAWPLVGLGTAYLFGRFLHGVEGGTELAPSVVSYLRSKRARTSSRATTRPTTQTHARSEAAGARRSR